MNKLNKFTSLVRKAKHTLTRVAITKFVAEYVAAASAIISFC